MPALALTDYGNMFGAIEFYFEAKKAGIKPIIGLEVYVAPEGRHKKQPQYRKSHQLVLLAQSYKGYQNLCKISSIGYQEGFYYVPRIDYEVLEKYNEDIIALSGGLRGDVPACFREKGSDAAMEKVKWYQKNYKDRFYLEMNLNLPECKESNNFLYEASQKLKVPTVAANNIHYLDTGDQTVQEVLICIASNKTLQDSTRFRLGSNQFNFKTSKEMETLFKDHPEALSNSLEIANRCHIEFLLNDKEGRTIYHLPSFSKKENPIETLRKLVLAGLKTKKVPQDKEDVYKKRVEKEIEIIGKMGFSGYFLIVQDFVNWSKKNGVPVGPGRGSGAGSLVAYCLGITELDPIPLGLIFERFLNPERVSMPDFDIDFCQDKRQKVLNYVVERYTPQNVSHIITYGKLQARAALRDVGRVMGMTYSEVDQVAKLIPDILGVTLSESLKKEPRLEKLIETDPRMATLFELSQKIEGVVRHASIHAAGIIIADGAIVSHAPLYRGSEGENIIQYDMKSSEKIGLIKFDFLGLKTLTHIHEAFRLIKGNGKKPLNTEDIPLNDKGIYEVLSQGDTAGVFQFEGSGVTDVITQLQPENFQDIMAINALYRPGPMENIPHYIERKKNSKKISYIFKELEEVLKETFGVIVYQEQVQLIAVKIANYTLGEADILRKAMGKKVHSEMVKQKKRFLEGAKQNNYDLVKAEKLFDTMAEFAKYGFNKSHAAAYCVLSAQTAFLKKYYPCEFYAALFSTEMNDVDKVARYIKDAQKHKIKIKPPHINSSSYKFTVKGDVIFFSLGGIKGVGSSAVENILETREKMPGGKFNTLEEFFEKVDLRRVNKKTIESLIKAGAFDGFGYHRHQLMKGFDVLVERAELLRLEKETGQGNLFSLDEDLKNHDKVRVSESERWPEQAQLTYEKEVLGLYLTGHPLKNWETLVQQQGWSGSHSFLDFYDLEHRSKVKMLGVITQIKEFITRKGQRMAFGRFENLEGFVELIFFSEIFQKKEFLWKSQKPILLTGAIDNRQKGNLKIIVEDGEDLYSKLESSKKVIFNIKESKDSEKILNLKELLKSYEGDIPLSFKFNIKSLSKTVNVVPEELKGVKPSLELFNAFYKLMGKESQVEIL